MIAKLNWVFETSVRLMAAFAFPICQSPPRSTECWTGVVMGVVEGRAESDKTVWQMLQAFPITFPVLLTCKGARTNKYERQSQEHDPDEALSWLV